MKGVFQVFLAKGSKSYGLFPAADSGLGFGRGLSHGCGVTLFGKVMLCNTKLQGILLVLGLMRGVRRIRGSSNGEKQFTAPGWA
jgi:hypothetical protein